MEGPCIRSFPRMALNYPVELRVGEKAIRLEHALGNLSVGGLFIQTEALPVNMPVHVKIAACSPFEADGVIRYSESNGQKGTGIEFTAMSEADRQHLDQLITELTRDGVPAS